MFNKHKVKKVKFHRRFDISFNLLVYPCIVIIVILLFAMFSDNCYGDSIYWIHKYSEKFGIDHRIPYAMSRVESDGKRLAYSSKGAIGVMQVMPETARNYFKWKIKNTDDPKRKIALLPYTKYPDIFYRIYLKQERWNILIGCWEYARCLKIFKGNYIKALSAYNMGVNNKKYNLLYVRDVIDQLLRIQNG